VIQALWKLSSTYGVAFLALVSVGMVPSTQVRFWLANMPASMTVFVHRNNTTVRIISLYHGTIGFPKSKSG
jgi:hypothetical protein